MDSDEIAWLLGRIAGLSTLLMNARDDKERHSLIKGIVREARALEREAEGDPVG